MGVGGGAGRAAGVAAGVGCDPCKRVEKKSWASWSSFWEVDGLGSATKLRAGVFSTGAAAFAGARRRLVMLSAPPASAAKKSFASAASFWDVVGDGAFRARRRRAAEGVEAVHRRYRFAAFPFSS